MELHLRLSILSVLYGSGRVNLPAIDVKVLAGEFEEHVERRDPLSVDKPTLARRVRRKQCAPATVLPHCVRQRTVASAMCSSTCSSSPSMIFIEEI